MCISVYDLVCDECREKYDEIFSKEPRDVEEEREMRIKWFKCLCKECKKILKEEGIVRQE